MPVGYVALPSFLHHIGIRDFLLPPAIENPKFPRCGMNKGLSYKGLSYLIFLLFDLLLDSEINWHYLSGSLGALYEAIQGTRL